MGVVGNFSFWLGKYLKRRKPPKAFQEWRSILWEIENNPDLISLTRKMGQAYQAHIAGEPCLDPKSAILFHSSTSPHWRTGTASSAEFPPPAADPSGEPHILFCRF